MGKEKADAPDYRGAAVEEGRLNRENLAAQTWANRPTQINPFGQTTWKATPRWDPATGTTVNEWTQRTTLNPASKRTLQNQMRLMKRRSELGAGMMGDLRRDLGPAMGWGQFGDMTGVDAPTGIGLGDLTQRISDPGAADYGVEQLQRELDYSGASAVDDPEFTRMSAEESLYGRQADRLNQRFDQEQNRLEITLANRGLRPGDAAYDKAMENFNIRKNDAFEGASAQAMQLGGQEAQRMFQMQQALRGMQTGEQDRMAQFANQAALGQFGMGSTAQQQGFADRLRAAELANQVRGQEFGERLAQQQFGRGEEYRFADFSNQQRQQRINEELMRRSQRLNEVNALIAGQQVDNPQFQGFMGAGQAQAPQLLNAASMQGQQAAADASMENQMWANIFGGATNLALGGMMMSDRRLKRDIRHIGEYRGYPLYSFKYLWGTDGIGVMADEVPDTAKVKIGEFEMVNYGAL